MLIKPSHALLAALALVTGPAFAQDAPAPSEPQSPAQSQPAEAPASGGTGADASEGTAADAPSTDPQPAAPAAEPADQDQQPAASAGTGDQAQQPADEATADQDPDRPGTYYAKSEHGDWTIRCIRSGQGKDPCELYKLLVDADDNPVAELTLIPLSNGNVAAGATLVAPLETDLIEGLGFQVDSGEMRGYPFSFCAPVGCISRLGFTEPEVTEMKRGNNASVQLMPFGGDPENPVRLQFSLSGFTAAFDELARYAAEPAPQADAPAAEPAEETTPAE